MSDATGVESDRCANHCSACDPIQGLWPSGRGLRVRIRIDHAIVRATHIKQSICRTIQRAIAHVQLENVFISGIESTAIDGFCGISAVNEIATADVDACGGIGRRGHVEAIVPAETDIIHPVKDRWANALGVARVIVCPERMVGGGVIDVPQSSARVATESPGVDRPLKREKFGRCAKGREIFISRKHHIAVIENDALRIGDIDRIASCGLLAIAPADRADDNVIAREIHRIIPKTDAIARRGLAGDGDFVFVHRESAARPRGETDVSRDGKNDRATCRGCGLDAVRKRARARGIEVGDNVDIAAAAAGRGGAIALRSGKRRELGIGRHRQDKSCQEGRRTGFHAGF